MYFTALLIGLQVVATTQLLVVGLVFGFTKFTRWKFLLLSLGLYVLFAHTSVVALVPALHTTKHSLVGWSIATIALD
jgi:hypothetical protein